MRLELFGALGDLGRATEIARVFAAHGLGDLMQRSGIARVFRRAGVAVRSSADPGPELTPPQRVRRAFEALGPTFVKFGQLLAGRTDLLPPEWTKELAELREHAAAVPWGELRNALREDLGGEPESFFAELDTQPLASASIAQVHRARLLDGTQVVLKIRRPGIVEAVERDLRLITHLVTIAERETPELRRRRLHDTVRQFAGSLRNELDLAIEARASKALAGDISAHLEIVVPRVHEAFTTQRLCVQDYVEGVSVDTWLKSPSFDAALGKRIAAAGARIVLEMIFVHGRYHADPHGGNVLLTPDGRLALLDFGMVGRLSEARRREVFELLTAVSARDEERVVELLLGWANGAEVDEGLLGSDVALFLDRYHGAKLSDFELARLLGDIAALLRSNDLVLPADLAMLLKVFVTLEDLGRSLDPQFQMAAGVEAFVERAVSAERSPFAALKRGIDEVRRTANALPRELRPWIQRLRRGRFHLEIELTRLDRFIHEFDRSVNRLTIGVVTSALIIGTSIALTVSGGPTLLGLPAFALVGFVTSLLLGVGLLISIARSGRD
jgi:ubiquinone biosynthesis protein